MKKYFLSLLILFFSSHTFSQTSLNVSLFGVIAPDTAKDHYYSGAWGYTAPNGKEYAILGGRHGTYFIEVNDSTNIRVAGFVPGPWSQWREFKVIHNYCYIISQVFNPYNQMQIVDLSFLPDSVHLAATFDSTFTSAHTIAQDELGDDHYIYVNGPLDPPDNGGVHILDISNPIHPVEVGRYSTAWIHDCHVRGDTLYACDFNAQNIDVVDIHDKKHPKIIGQISGTGPSTHSCWTTKDGKHIMVYNEVDAFPSYIYDISDLGNISRVASFRGDTTAVVHNGCIKGDFAYVANNIGGFRVVDLTKPDVPVEAGFYDTYFDTGTHSNGCFETYPYLPSGKLLASDRQSGLFVFRFNQTRAGRIYGTVENRDSTPIINAEIELVEKNLKTHVDLEGAFKLGALPSAEKVYTMQIRAAGMVTKTIYDIHLHQGDSLMYHITLDSLLSSTGTILMGASISIKENPVKDQLLIRINNIPGNKGLLTLYDYEGKKVFETPVMTYDANEELVIPIPPLPSSVYLLTLQIGSQRFVQKIMKE